MRVGGMRVGGMTPLLDEKGIIVIEKIHYSKKRALPHRVMAFSLCCRTLLERRGF